MKYNDVSNRIEQVPLINALSEGKKYMKSGISAGLGRILRFNTITAIKTKTETPKIHLKTILSLITNSF
jgi:hypothetical protein